MYMSLFYLLISCIILAIHAKDTVVVFGGNGFVGRRICKEAIARSYRVISVSRSGCAAIWANDEWAKEVEWFSADALNIDSFKDYITKQNPVAVFTMMGTLNAYKQITSPESIFEYAGTTNINVCNVAASIKSVKKFVYIGADVKHVGINPQNADNAYALWTQFWLGQYNAKVAVEQCVDDKFGVNGISLRPNLIAGKERVEIFGNLLEFNRLPFYETPSVRNFYQFMIPDALGVEELADDALDFIEGTDANTFNILRHSQRPEEEMSPFKVLVLENADNILLGIISIGVMFCGCFILRLC